MRSSWPFALGAIPILALIGALPFVNRVEPVVLGLPFVLFWILGWVLLTPAFLGAAYAITRPGAEAPGPTTETTGGPTTASDRAGFTGDATREHGAIDEDGARR